MTGRDGKQYPATKPKAAPPAKQHKPAPPPADGPDPWAGVVSQLTQLADALTGLAPTPNEGTDPCRLVASLESTGRALLRKANDIRRKLHL